MLWFRDGLKLATHSRNARELTVTHVTSSGRKGRRRKRGDAYCVHNMMGRAETREGTAGWLREDKKKKDQWEGIQWRWPREKSDERGREKSEGGEGEEMMRRGKRNRWEESVGGVGNKKKKIRGQEGEGEFWGKRRASWETEEEKGDKKKEQKTVK